jgi:hypothetical protein
VSVVYDCETAWVASLSLSLFVLFSATLGRPRLFVFVCPDRLRLDLEKTRADAEYIRKTGTIGDVMGKFRACPRGFQFVLFLVCRDVTCLIIRILSLSL